MEHKKIHLMYGFVTSLAIIILGLVLHFANLSFEKWAFYVQLLPFVVGIILNANAYAKAMDYNVTFGKVFSSCFRACAIIALVMIAWTFISLQIFPEIKDKAIEMATEDMATRGMSDEQVDQAMEMTKKFFTPFAVAGALFIYMFWGALFSLIGAAIAKKRPQRQQTV
jgi:hypothetical protein